MSKRIAVAHEFGGELMAVLGISADTWVTDITFHVPAHAPVEVLIKCIVSADEMKGFLEALGRYTLVPMNEAPLDDAG